MMLVVKHNGINFFLTTVVIYHKV